MSTRLHIAVFADPDRLLHAIGVCRRAGLEVRDAYTPYPVHGIEEALGLRRSRLPVLCFLAGTFGLALALVAQYWTSAADWPLNVGGKPLDSLPAFVPVAFETMVLCAGLATAAGFLLRSRLYPGKASPRRADRVTDDRFALEVLVPGALVSDEALQAMFTAAGACEVRQLLEEQP